MERLKHAAAERPRVFWKGIERAQRLVHLAVQIADGVWPVAPWQSLANRLLLWDTTNQRCLHCHCFSRGPHSPLIRCRLAFRLPLPHRRPPCSCSG